MAAMRGPRPQVGSAAWISEERSSALQITQTEVEEFSYSARNEMDWLNEHMAGIFDENEINLAETFKTPGKLRGKTPRTIRKANASEARVPLSDVFAPTSNGPSNRTPAPNHVQSPRVLASVAKSVSPIKMHSPLRQMFSPKPAGTNMAHGATQDSGYFGSQDNGGADVVMSTQPFESQLDQLQEEEPSQAEPLSSKQSPTKPTGFDSPTRTFQTAREEQTMRVLQPAAAIQPREVAGPSSELQEPASEEPSSPMMSSPPAEPKESTQAVEPPQQPDILSSPNEARSPSDGSSPIRPMVRKSSLNFASLPAREPLAAGKSIGARVSRTSHLDNNRTSYYNRPTGGKSLGNLAKHDLAEDGDDDPMDVDKPSPPRDAKENVALNHNKTYTQRLQDQISMLGKTQSNTHRQSRSMVNASAAPNVANSQAPALKSPSPRKEITTTTPGAFPEDEDEDDWIEPPATVSRSEAARPVLAKSHTTDVMEEIHGKSTIGGSDLDVEPQAPTTPGRGQPTSRAPPVHGHHASSSVSIPLAGTSSEFVHDAPLVRANTLANLPTSAVADLDSPPKSPARSFRDSPLKQVKNKMSSVLKFSRGLLASGAAISAEGKASLLSPSTTRLGLYPSLSSESLARAIPQSPKAQPSSQLRDHEKSPSRPAGRRTRASVEREKEEKRREKEAKRMADQMEKLEQAREKEREKTRVFSKEQEKAMALEKQMASKPQNEPPMVKETPKPVRTSPRKNKPAEEEHDGGVRDVEMQDVPSSMPPPSVPRSAGPAQSMRNNDSKRPVKPAKEALTKAKQAPTVIRVNTGSQHSQFHPAAGAMHNRGSSVSQAAGHQLVTKASKASLQHKASTQSLKSSVSSTGRPKAADALAKKREQEEREAQRRREAKAEMERKRAAAAAEEQRKQEQQRQKEAEQAAEAKKTAQRQAAIERAKQTRAPPPAIRSQVNNAHDGGSAAQRAEGQVRPPSRMTAGGQRQDDTGRPVNAILSSSVKAGAKRPVPGEYSEDGHAKRPPSRGGPSYQAKDSKRRRTSEEFDEDLEMSYAPNIKGPPVRPSGGFKKDVPGKSVFQSGYSAAPPSATRDLFKATVKAQHNNQTKAAHPLDMAQISKGAIPFAPNPNPAGSSYKTPARPGALNNIKSAAKSAQRSSPRFQNGESIELPEIQTDDEDEDEDEAHGGTIASWADSPDLRRALREQESMDPSSIFGPPAPLNMEEVFNKSKDKWHKFRARTSSANWSGSDRLTEDDIRKDMAAREKLRREGGWSYEMSKDML
ncbi:hypothetical protein B0I35DRAFT_11862 [Stachybotrys elegans]|uniref:Inner centromere protein ARK-binding domain-containing protein n=1 Tax=Stachybotrys elegans TaxID=80388 RepID=A0A8K0T3K6_9HYPO|nr:hypothetical protein B0I35DRAFT_11862 [Stachybotrys elegans]